MSDEVGQKDSCFSWLITFIVILLIFVILLLALSMIVESGENKSRKNDKLYYKQFELIKRC